jgi:hypothetical protein
MQDECEAVLTDAQKDLLKERREAAKVARATTKGSAGSDRP